MPRTKPTDIGKHSRANNRSDSSAATLGRFLGWRWRPLWPRAGLSQEVHRRYAAVALKHPSRPCFRPLFFFPLELGTRKGQPSAARATSSSGRRSAPDRRNVAAESIVALSPLLCTPLSEPAASLSNVSRSHRQHELWPSTILMDAGFRLGAFELEEAGASSLAT